MACTEHEGNADTVLVGISDKIGPLGQIWLRWEDNIKLGLNRLTPNDPYMGRTAPLTSKRCILYIYSTNIGTEYFKRALYSPIFSLQNAVCFIMLTCLVPVLFTFYVQGVLKLKKNNSGYKGLIFYLTKMHVKTCFAVQVNRPSHLPTVRNKADNAFSAGVRSLRPSLFNSAITSHSKATKLMQKQRRHAHETAQYHK